MGSIALPDFGVTALFFLRRFCGGFGPERGQGNRCMRQFVWMIAMAVGMVSAVWADDAWVQVEARPTLAEAQARAQAYAQTFTNVQGYRLPSGWYGIVVGPFSADEAARQLDLLLGERMIPADSFVATGNRFGPQFWPGDATTVAAAPTAPQPAETIDPADSAEAALADEAAMSAQDRQAVQQALAFAGVYKGKTDGAFGKGTRAAMAAWQAAQGLQPTGLLTRSQRDKLLQPWKQETDLLGMAPVNETEAGITVDLPMGLVAFDRYDPPFVRYPAKGGSGYTVLLISARGDQTALGALHDRIAALGLVPQGGQDTVGTGFLSMSGVDATRQAFAEAERKGGFIKGFLIAGPAGQEDRMKRILAAMEASFATIPDTVLDEHQGVASTVSQSDLTSGLDPRRPALSHSGVYVDAAGSVLTASDGLDGCARLTLDSLHEARLVWQDTDAGIALLTPTSALAPRGFASLAPALPAADAVVAIGSYPFGDRLSAPVVSFGAFAEARGLKGETDRARLTLKAEPGDAGAAVLDDHGEMVGLLLPRAADGAQSLPGDVAFLVPAADLSARLAAAGHALPPTAAANQQLAALAPEDLAARARGMTALVSCWK